MVVTEVAAILHESTVHVWVVSVEAVRKSLWMPNRDLTNQSVAWSAQSKQFESISLDNASRSSFALVDLQQ